MCVTFPHELRETGSDDHCNSKGKIVLQSPDRPGAVLWRSEFLAEPSSPEG